MFYFNQFTFIDMVNKCILQKNVYSAVAQVFYSLFLVVVSIIEGKTIKCPTIIVEWVSALKYFQGALKSICSKLILYSLKSISFNGPRCSHQKLRSHPRSLLFHRILHLIDQQAMVILLICSLLFSSFIPALPNSGPRISYQNY